KHYCAMCNGRLINGKIVDCLGCKNTVSVKGEISPNQEGNHYYCPKCNLNVLNCEHDELVKVVDSAKHKKRKLKSILISPQVEEAKFEKDRKAAMSKFSSFGAPKDLNLREQILVSTLLDISKDYPKMTEHVNYAA